MYKLSLLALATFFLFNTTISQVTNDDSGMKLTHCEFEPDAPAVVIFDKGETRFIRDDNGFIIQHKRHKRIKIFKEAAFDQAEIIIPLYQSESDFERVRDIEGTTYYFNGSSIETTPLDPKQIFREPINKYWYQKKFALPNVKEGCIIEYSYILETPFFMHLPDWDFQSDIPTIYSEYLVSMIPFYTYTYRAQGFPNFDIFDKKEDGFERSFMGLTFRDLDYKFALKNVPSFKDETFISSREDYVKKIDFQLSEINYPSGYSKKIMTTWPKLVEEFNDYTEFGKYIKKCEKLGSKNFIYLIGKSEKERVNAVLDYMKSNYKPNGYINKYASKSIKEFDTKKTGNTANINLMALGILKGIGIEAYPVLISTRDHGKVTASFPFSDLFNDVLILAVIDGKQQLLDATDAYCPNDMIPAYCCNGKGFVATEDGNTWVRVSSKKTSISSTSLRYKLNADKEKLSGTGVVRNTGHTSISERKRYNKDSEEFVKQMESKGISLSDNIAINDKTDSKVFQYDYSFNGDIDKIDNQIIFSPFLNLPIQTNPFKQEKRELAIDMVYPATKSFQAEIEIPNGYIIEQLPEAYNKNSANTAFSFKAYKTENNTVIISATYQLKKAIYPASVYPELKRLYNKIIKKLNQKIVVVKDENLALE